MIRLAIDCDGVIANFHEGFSRILNSIRPGAIPQGWEPESWEGYTESELVSRDEYAVAWRVLKDRPSFWLDLQAYAMNCADLTHYEMRCPGEIYFLTSRIATGGVSAQEQTEYWLRHLSLDRRSVITVPRPEAKLPVATALGFTALIDDNVETFYDMRCAGLNCYLHDRPWNRVKTDFEEYRVSSLREFLEKEGGLACRNPSPKENALAR